MLKVIGHTPPDTDTVCSPIVYAWYLSNRRGTPAQAFRSGDLNKETQFVLDYFGVEVPDNLESFSADDEVVIIDTNNPDELITGYDVATIVELIDHHKLTGGLSTSSPIRITIRPTGCSASIIWEIIKGEGNQDIPMEMAGLLLACILSDTLKFSSPTSTEKDRDYADELALLAEVDIDEFAEKLFDAKSNLDGFTSEEIVKMDSKVYEMGGDKIRFSVMETTKPQILLAMESDLKETMNAIKSEDSLGGLYFFFFFILENASTLIVTSDKEREVAEKAFGESFDENGRMYLPGVVSRKKQMIPMIEGVL